MEKEQMNEAVEKVEVPKAQEGNRKKEMEELCRKIMKVVIPCICLMLILLLIFKGSGEARDVKRALKSEGCDVEILTDRDEISEVLDILGLDLMNVEEAVVAAADEDPALFAFVLFFESRLDAEEAEEEFLWLLYNDPEADSYRVERNGKAVCFGYVDLVDASMEALD